MIMLHAGCFVLSLLWGQSNIKVGVDVSGGNFIS